MSQWKGTINACGVVYGRIPMSTYWYCLVLGDTQVFSTTFANINTGSFDPNYPASLTVDCEPGGGVYMYTGAFADMSHVQHFKVSFFSYLVSIFSYLVSISSYLVIISLYLVNISSYLVSISSYLVSVSSYLVSISSYLVSISSYLVSISSY